MGTKKLISKSNGTYFHANGGKTAKKFSTGETLGCATDISNLYDPEGFILFRNNNESFVVKSKHVKIGIDCNDDKESKGEDNETSKGSKDGNTLGLNDGNGLFSNPYLLYILGGIIIFKIIDWWFNFCIQEYEI